jgi:NAD(P)-dependent dehydrogenase (short-subunit alcohol dehydrogenase family)
MLDDTQQRLGRLDALVLNASGGMERDADRGNAIRLNRDAQESLALLSPPLMPPGGRTVFITSHRAHFHGRKAVPRDYLPVAVSKRAGEDAPRAMRPTLEDKGIALVVVSGDMIDGTVTVRLLERRDPDAVAARRAVATAADCAGIRQCGRLQSRSLITRVSRSTSADRTICDRPTSRG